jgi:small subunit ribosomal protein S2
MDFRKLPKKEGAFTKQYQKLDKYLGGMKNMDRIRYCIIGKEEMNAVKECKKLGIRSITILDTDCDPTPSRFTYPSK